MAYIDHYHELTPMVKLSNGQVRTTNDILGPSAQQLLFDRALHSRLYLQHQAAQGLAHEAMQACPAHDLNWTRFLAMKLTKGNTYRRSPQTATSPKHRAAGLGQSIAAGHGGPHRWRNLLPRAFRAT